MLSLSKWANQDESHSSGRELLALLCLIANTAPVAWGGIGTPLRTLSAVTGLDVEALSGTCGRILPLLSVLIPFWLVRTMTGWRNTLEVWLPLAVIGDL